MHTHTHTHTHKKSLAGFSQPGSQTVRPVLHFPPQTFLPPERPEKALSWAERKHLWQNDQRGRERVCVVILNLFPTCCPEASAPLSFRPGSSDQTSLSAVCQTLAASCVCVIKETRSKQNQRILVKTPDISRESLWSRSHDIFTL